MSKCNLVSERMLCVTLLMILALLVGVGCSSQSEDAGEAQATDSEAASSAASAAATTGADEATAEGAAADDEYVSCSMCGMKVLKSEAVFVDGKLLCAHCVPESHGDGSQEQDASEEKKSGSQ